MQKIDRTARLREWPLGNFWVGTSVEDQERADERIPILSEVNAAIRFLSVGGLLKGVSIEKATPAAKIGRIDWVIVGGESGPGARPMHPTWARALRDDCRRFGITFFFKQVGSWAWLLKDRKGRPARFAIGIDGNIVPVGTRGSQPIVRGSKKIAGRALDARRSHA